MKIIIKLFLAAMAMLTIMSCSKDNQQEQAKLPKTTPQNNNNNTPSYPLIQWDWNDTTVNK